MLEDSRSLDSDYHPGFYVSQENKTDQNYDQPINRSPRPSKSSGKDQYLTTPNRQQKTTDVDQTLTFQSQKQWKSSHHQKQTDSSQRRAPKAKQVGFTAESRTWGNCVDGAHTNFTQLREIGTSIKNFGDSVDPDVSWIQRESDKDPLDLGLHISHSKHRTDITSSSTTAMSCEIGNNISYGPTSVMIICQHCHTVGMTALNYRTGVATIAWAAAICFCGGCFGCCLIPFFKAHTKDIEHRCQACLRVVGVSYRSVATLGFKGGSGT